MSLAYEDAAIAAIAPIAPEKEASIASFLFALFIALIVGLSFAAWHDIASLMTHRALRRKPAPRR